MVSRKKKVMTYILLISMFLLAVYFLLNLVIANGDGYHCVENYLQQEKIYEQYGRLKRISLFFDSKTMNDPKPPRMYLQFIAKNEDGSLFRCSFYLIRENHEWQVKQADIYLI